MKAIELVALIEESRKSGTEPQSATLHAIDMEALQMDLAAESVTVAVRAADVKPLPKGAVMMFYGVPVYQSQLRAYHAPSVEV